MREVGRGGMGAVFEARRVSDGARVALKVITGARSKTADERFQREAESASKLDHPNIIRVLDYGEAEGRLYLAMEFFESRTFEQLLDERIAAGSSAASPERSIQELRRFVRIVVRAARALHYAHESGVVHRDIKPGNILVGTDPAETVKLADFGLARSMKAGDTLTAAGQIIGTLAYMSPEQISPKRTALTRRSDVYALGITLYEVLARRLPFDAPSTQLLLRRIRDDPSPPPRRFDPAIPRDLEVVCLKALEKAPRDRYENACEFADDLERFLRREPIMAKAPGPLGRAVRRLRRRKKTAATGAHFLIAAIGIG